MSPGLLTMLSRSPGVTPTGSPPSMLMGTVGDDVTLKVSLPARPLTWRDSVLLYLTVLRPPTVTAAPSTLMVSPALVALTVRESLPPAASTLRSPVLVVLTTGLRLPTWAVAVL